MLATIQKVTLVAGLLISMSYAWAGEFEQPPSFTAEKLLGTAVRGGNYSVISPVTSDGYLRTYTVKTRYSVFKVNGDQLLFLRIKELNALNALEEIANSKSFADAVVNAGLSPVEFAGNLVTKPVGTLKNTVSGVGALFGGIASGVRNAGKAQVSVVASVTGAAKQIGIDAQVLTHDANSNLKTEWAFGRDFDLYR